jgi:hypothetical protein
MSNPTGLCMGNKTMRNGKTLLEGRGRRKRYASTLKGYLVKIKRHLKGIKRVFIGVGVGQFTVLRRALVCRN